MAVPATVSKKHALRVAKTSKTEERREVVRLLVVSGKQPPNKIAKQFGVSLQTIYSDIRVLREEVQEALVVDESGRAANTVLTDAIAGSNERIKRLWELIRENEEEKEAILEGLHSGIGDDKPLLNTDFAKAIMVYDKNVRDTMKQIRAEEEHQSKLLKRFGVVSEQVNVNQKLTVQDNTPMVNALANSINQTIEDPKEREKLKHEIFKRLQSST